jgi:DNA-binding response OmpR family regulator
MRVLLVEDQADLARHIRRAMERVGHEIRVAQDGPGAVKAAASQSFDLILLDLNLPGFDGFEVMRRIGTAHVRPRVLMLTSRGEVSDRVKGLKAGADDYLTKPFAMEELLARIEAMGRRVLPGIDGNLLSSGPLRLDVLRRRMLQNGYPVDLSPREFELLQVLMREPGRTFSRGELFERVWGRAHLYESKTVEIFITRLRKKIDLPGMDSFIETVRGVGYKLRDHPADGEAEQASEPDR